MAVQEQMPRNQQKQIETFEWKLELFMDGYSFNQTTRCSPFFHFCEYYCRLYYTHILELSNTDVFRVIINLKGHGAESHTKISCNYSLSSKDNFGREQLHIINTMQISNKAINVQIFDGDIVCPRYRDRLTCLNFVLSWSENVGVNVTEQENCISVVECATQTESTQPPAIGSIGTETEAEHYTFLETLSNDFERFYEDKTDTDCVLKVDKIKFPVHRFVLAARSPVFAAMFHHDMSERQNGEVDILDVNPDALGDIIFFMYTGRIRGLSPDTAASLYTAADKYSLHNLRIKCLDFLIHNLTMDNICDAALVAHTHSEAELENRVVQFIKVRMQELIENEKWRHFSATNFLLANKFLSYALIASQTGNS